MNTANRSIDSDGVSWYEVINGEGQVEVITLHKVFFYAVTDTSQPPAADLVGHVVGTNSTASERIIHNAGSDTLFIKTQAACKLDLVITSNAVS